MYNLFRFPFTNMILIQFGGCGMYNVRTVHVCSMFVLSFLLLKYLFIFCIASIDCCGLLKEKIGKFLNKASFDIFFHFDHLHPKNYT